MIRAILWGILGLFGICMQKNPMKCGLLHGRDCPLGLEEPPARFLRRPTTEGTEDGEE